MEKIHILGSNYHTQLLAQIPKENLPTTFGGDCVCEGGCQFSDAGPWQATQPEPTPTATATAPSPSPAPEPTPATTIATPAAAPTQS